MKGNTEASGRHSNPRYFKDKYHNAHGLHFLHRPHLRLKRTNFYCVRITSGRNKKLMIRTAASEKEFTLYSRENNNVQTYIAIPKHMLMINKQVSLYSNMIRLLRFKLTI